MLFGRPVRKHAGREVQFLADYNRLKIENAVVTHVRVPLVEPFRISSGAVSEKDAIVVSLRADGLTGYGESSPMTMQPGEDLIVGRRLREILRNARKNHA